MKPTAAKGAYFGPDILPASKTGREGAAALVDELSWRDDVCLLALDRTAIRHESSNFCGGDPQRPAPLHRSERGPQGLQRYSGATGQALPLHTFIAGRHKIAACRRVYRQADAHDPRQGGTESWTATDSTDPWRLNTTANARACFISCSCLHARQNRTRERISGHGRGTAVSETARI